MVLFSAYGYGITGQHPGIIIPGGLSQNGLPVSLELDGFPGQAEDLLAVAKAITEAFHD